ncbi:MAG: hypothetical protein M1155_00035 [Patescibacteria group bacterium]|nr:hypothetical protein [Patescibacteria group bacterium]
MLQYVFSFIVGGLVTTAIVYFEASGLPLLSRLAALVPVFTWLAYLLMGDISGPKEISSHALFVLLGTLVAWVPYMFTIYYMAPRIGSVKAVLLGILVFLILAIIFIKIYKI